MAIWQFVLIILAVLLAMVGLCAGVIFLERKFPTDDYDERQKQAHGNAYRLCFWVGILYFLCVAGVLMEQMEGTKTVEPYLLVVIGILMLIMLDHTYCVLTHSDLPLSQRRSGSIAFYLLWAVTRIGKFVMGLDYFELSMVGQGSKPLVYLLTGICTLYLAVMHIIQYFLERKG